MKISVIIPTKDDELVFEAIDSVLDQSYSDFELVVVDASEGAHQESLESYCESNDVAYIREQEAEGHSWGLNAARNIGVQATSGEIVALLDGDCLAEEEWLENLVEYFENHDVVECNVQYASDREKNCPMDRIIENSGRDYRFLGAGLAFKREVWKRAQFQEDFKFLRGDTAFGFEAIENGFSYTYGEEAVIKHHAGRFSSLEFLKERLRFVEEPKFFKRFRDHPQIDREISNISRILYPKELAFLTALTAAIAASTISIPVSAVATASLMTFSELLFLKRVGSKRELDLCPFDLFRSFFLIPLTLFVRRYAIWKGAVRDKIAVI